MRYFWLMLFSVLLVWPVMGGTDYISGPPELSVAISGTNEFSPGQFVTLPLAIENKGLIQLELIRPDLVSPYSLPNTAMLTTVGLEPGDAPMAVKSEPQMIGDVPGGVTREVPFNIQVDQYAPAGTYQLRVSLEYTYIWFATSEGQDNIAYYYKTDQDFRDLTVVIRPMVVLQVLNVSTGYLNTGTEGYVNLTLENVGYDHAREAVIYITPGTVSPLQPTDSSQYIGEFPPGDRVDVSFKVSVPDSAEAHKTYPFNVYCEYLNFENITAISDPVTFGVPIGGKIQFAVISAPPEIHPGEEKVIEVTYKNTGSESVTDAQVRLSAISPFTSTDDTAYLGSLARGATATARFDMTVDGSATVKEYGLDSEIRYRDELDNTQISSTIKVPVRVTEAPGILQSYGPIIAAVIIIAVIIGGVLVWRRRRKP